MFRFPSTDNVKTYFYRDEFQDKGTLQVHLLIWLNSLKYIDYKRIHASVPMYNCDEAYKVCKTLLHLFTLVSDKLH